MCAPSFSATSRAQAGTLECSPHNTLPIFSATLHGTHLDVRKSECMKPPLQPVLSKHILSIILTNWLIFNIKFIYRKYYKYLHDQSSLANSVDPVFWVSTNEKVEMKNVAVELTLITHLKFDLQVEGSFAEKFIWRLFIQQQLGYQTLLTVSGDTNSTTKYLYSTTPSLVGSFHASRKFKYPFKIVK